MGFAGRGGLTGRSAAARRAGFVWSSVPLQEGAQPWAQTSEPTNKKQTNYFASHLCGNSKKKKKKQKKNPTIVLICRICSLVRDETQCEGQCARKLSAKGGNPTAKPGAEARLCVRPDDTSVSTLIDQDQIMPNVQWNINSWNYLWNHKDDDQTWICCPQLIVSSKGGVPQQFFFFLHSWHHFLFLSHDFRWCGLDKLSGRTWIK